jgi:hypothetical protein
LREDAQKLREEKTTLERMIQSCDELILEMAEEYGENNDGEDEDDDDDDEGNVVAPPAPAPAAVPEEIIEEVPVENVHMSWMIWMTWVLPCLIQMKAALTWMNGFPKMGVTIEIVSSSLSL